MATTKRNSTVNPAAGTRAIAPKPSSRKAAHNHPRAIALAVATAFLPWFVPQAAHAQTPPPAPAPNTLPVLQVKQGGGQGTVHERQGNLLRIDQLTQRMILEGSFTVGADGIVRLVQPGRSAVALVNDTSGIGSRIFGKAYRQRPVVRFQQLRCVYRSRRAGGGRSVLRHHAKDRRSGFHERRLQMVPRGHGG